MKAIPMPRTTCDTCGNPYEWHWEEAFSKFGFGDGDGQVETHTVALVLERAGYTVTTWHWGLHNTIITSITRNGAEQIPAATSVGYADPRRYLPPAIVRLLDERLPADEEARP